MLLGIFMSAIYRGLLQVAKTVLAVYDAVLRALLWIVNKLLR